MKNVLHILDMAGVPSILSHFYNKYGNGKSDIIYHKKNNFSQNISEFYEGKYFKKFRKLLIYGLIHARNYDIIHIHGSETLVPVFKITGKKIILHYHGSDINDDVRSRSKKRIFCRSMADLIIYNGKKMESKIITNKRVKKSYLPNPIDTELFTSISKNRKGSLSFVSGNLDKKKTIEEISQIYNAEIIDLDYQQIPYRVMPKFLSGYETYVDIKITKGGYRLPDLSTTALQALACGCKVFHDNQIIDALPQAHEPYYVIKKLNSLYDEVAN